MLAWQAIAAGTTAKTASDREKYWTHWCAYASILQVDPFLRSTTPLQRDIALTAFAARVRTGSYGRGAKIKVSGVQDALVAISKTIELAGERSPLYRDEGKYNLPIERLVEGFRRNDPPAVPQLAIPISVPNHCYKATLTTADEHFKAAGQLSLIAFYYLLRVGEYTKPRFVHRNGKKVKASKTVQFSAGNVGFFKDGKLLPRTSSLEVLLTADAATLKITNQKNGRMGQTIHQEATGLLECPIKALTYRVHHIYSNGGDNDTFLCDVFDSNSQTWSSITSQDMIKMLRSAANDLNLGDQAIDPDLIGAHSHGRCFFFQRLNGEVAQRYIALRRFDLHAQ